MCGAFGWAGGRDLVVSIVGTMTRVVRSEFSLVLFMYTFYAKSMLKLATLLIILNYYT
jgi:hypothetical protein